MQLDNKEIIDYINKEIDDYNGFAKGFYEDIKKWKQSSKAKNKKLDNEEKDFETDTSNQMHIHSIKDLSPYLVFRLNKAYGDQYQDINTPFHVLVFCPLCLLYLPLLVINFIALGGYSTAFDPIFADEGINYNFFWICFNYFWIIFPIFFFIYLFTLIFLTYHYKIRKKKHGFM